MDTGDWQEGCPRGLLSFFSVCRRLLFDAVCCLFFFSLLARSARPSCWLHKRRGKEQRATSTRFLIFLQFPAVPCAGARRGAEGWVLGCTGKANTGFGRALLERCCFALERAGLGETVVMAVTARVSTPALPVKSCRMSVDVLQELSSTNDVACRSVSLANKSGDSALSACVKNSHEARRQSQREGESSSVIRRRRRRRSKERRRDIGRKRHFGGKLQVVQPVTVNWQGPNEVSLEVCEQGFRVHC